MGTAAQFVKQFGLAQSDLHAVTEWLSSHGLKVNFITPAMSIDFSGTAGQVREAFHTEIHYLDTNGEHHFANVTNPKIPATLADAVLGPVALHDFKPHPLASKVKPPITQYTVNADYQLVVPGDLATIYDYNPLYSAGDFGPGTDGGAAGADGSICHGRLEHVPQGVRPYQKLPERQAGDGAPAADGLAQ